MKRREFITLFGGAVAAPLAGAPEARAQNPPRVGWMFPGISAGNPTELAGFKEGLRETRGSVCGDDARPHRRPAARCLPPLSDRLAGGGGARARPQAASNLGDSRVSARRRT